jgi:hypothetical protein
LPGLDAVNLKFQSQNMGATLTSTLTSNVLNDAKFGLNINSPNFGGGGLNVLNSIGSVDRFGRGRDYSLPDIAGFGCFTLGDTNGQVRRTGTWTAADDLSWVKGPHTMKVGGDFRLIFDNGSDRFFSRDALTFSGFTNFGQAFIDINPSTCCSALRTHKRRRNFLTQTRTGHPATSAGFASMSTAFTSRTLGK